ncbi:MAG: hypothetical protein WCD35_15310 [Mycobacteriales bacterium]
MNQPSPVCDSCGRPAAQLFPGLESGSSVCSRCYERLRLHARGPLWTIGGWAAIVAGAVIVVLSVIGFVLLLRHP